MSAGRPPGLTAVRLDAAPEAAPDPANEVEAHPEVVPKAVELTVVVPTFNEAQNVEPMVALLTACLRGIAWEVIFVDDDSPDGTSERVLEIGRLDRRVRCLRRIGRRGLSSACIEGMLASSAPYLAVIDGDQQHDEKLLPEMLRVLRDGDGDTDIVVGSRFLEGAAASGLSESRLKTSRLGKTLSRLVLRADLSDPMSGYFMLRREVFEDCVQRLSGLGFKILVDLFASAKRPLRTAELPYRFRPRGQGESKLDAHVAWDYGMLLLDKLIGHLIPVRFVAFSLVGGLGIFVHMAVLTALFRGFQVDFVYGQTAATLLAMLFNFAVNNALTYRDRRLSGLRWLRGLLSFVIACSVGALANVGIAAYLFEQEALWVISALAGVLVGAVWNFSVTSVYTWKSAGKA